MLHIIQNDPQVPPGNLCDDLAVPYVVHHPYRGERLPEAASLGALIVLGGAMGANDDERYPFLRDLKQLIRVVVEREIPYLGICLGGQMLAAALGGEVVSNRWEELGTLSVELTAAGVSDRLFSRLAGSLTTFQWHHDSFDLPPGATLLASSTACQNQAFRVGSCAWGVQFHPEVTEPIIRDWCAWDPRTLQQSDRLVEEFSSHDAPYRAIARQLWLNFLSAYHQELSAPATQRDASAQQLSVAPQSRLIRSCQA